MEYVNLLLFSSPAELDRMRGALGDFLHVLNDRGRDFRYELGAMEGGASAPATASADALEESLREEERKIRDCRFLYVVAGRDAGNTFLRELDVVLNGFRDGPAPEEIQAYTAPEAEETAFRLAVRMRETGSACRTLSHPDAVKLDVLLGLERLDLLPGALEFREGQAVVDDTPVLPLMNVPMYAKNREIQRLLAARNAMETEYRQLQDAVRDQPNDSQALSRLLELTRSRGRVTQDLRQAEAALLDLCVAVAGRGHSTWRIRQAGRLLEEGDFQGALEVLKNERRQEELARAERVRERALLLAERQLDKVRDCVREDRLRIAALRSGDAEEAAQAGECYAEAASLAEQYQVELDVLYEYASWLWEQQEYTKAVEVGGRLGGYYEERGASAEDRAALENLLGNCCLDGEDLEGAEAHYRAALALYRDLASGDPASWEADAASAYANLASLLHLSNRWTEAEGCYREALDIRRRLARSPAYAPEAAETASRLANLLSAAGRPEEAARYYTETLEFARRPGAEAYAAAANRNLARLLEAQGKRKEAERRYQSALEAFRTLAADDPDAWAADAASLCRSTAILLDNMGRRQEAEPLYREALSRFRVLEEDDPEEWAASIAMTCEDLADLVREDGRDAESLYREALDRFHDLAEKNGGWDTEIAEISGNLAELLRTENRGAEAERLGRDALHRFRLLAETDPDAYEPDVAVNCGRLAAILKDAGRAEEAEPLCREALDRFRELGELDPDAWERSIATACGTLAGLLKEAGQREEAEELYREALDRFRELSDPSSPDAAAVCRDLADLLGDAGRAQEAERLYCDALDVYRKLAEKRPAVWEPEVAMTSNNLAVFLKGAGRPEAADWFYRVALDSYRKLAKKNPDTYAPYVASICCNLASLLADTGRNAEAERFYRVALDAWRRLAEKAPETYAPDVADTCGYLGVFLLAAKHDRDGAKELFQEALSIYDKYPHLAGKAESTRQVLAENFPEDEGGGNS